jgi:hypothetical protein
MTSNDFVSVDHLLAEITSTVNDTEFKNGFAKGWYISRIQDALQELSIDTFWLKVKHDFEIPTNCRIPMPENVFNIREIYLYTGSLCSPQKSQVVYWKRLFDNSYDGTGYTAKVKDDGSNSNDLFQPNQSYNSLNGNNGFRGVKYYYNVGEDGIIMLSRECLGYPYLRIVFNGMGVPNGDMPTVPRFFERAVVDYVEERFYNAMKSRDVRMYRPLWTDAFQKLNDLTSGSWNKARKRIKSMDSSEKESMEEYISSMYHK